MIRKMTSKDKASVLKLIEEFSDDKLSLFGMSFDKKGAGLYFDFMINSESLVAFVAEVDGKIVGMISGVIGSKVFTASRTLQEMGWFVSKKNRGVGIRLLRAFENEGKIRGCSDILIGGFASDPSNEIYKKLGYREVQTSYIKEVKNEA